VNNLWSYTRELKKKNYKSKNQKINNCIVYNTFRKKIIKHRVNLIVKTGRYTKFNSKKYWFKNQLRFSISYRVPIYQTILYQTFREKMLIASTTRKMNYN